MRLGFLNSINSSYVRAYVKQIKWTWYDKLNKRKKKKASMSFISREPRNDLFATTEP